MKGDPALASAMAPDQGVGAEAAAHLVVKRGHRGRYRLTLIHEGVRVKAELIVAGVQRADRTADGRALALLAEAAAALVTTIATAQVKP